MKLRIPAWLRLLSILQVNGLRSHFVPKKKLVSDEVICKNCDTHYVGNFCPVCGQSRKTRRLSFLNMVDDIISLVFNLESGFLRTASELFWRPGHMIRDYINGHRKPYMKPVTMLFCLGTIYYLTIWILAKDSLPTLGTQDEEIQLGEKLSKYTPLLLKSQELLTDMLRNPGLLAFCFILPMTPAANLCFHFTRLGKVFNLTEHLHALMFIGSQMLIVTWGMALFHAATRSQLTFLEFDGLYFLLFLTWDYHQLFQIRWRRSFKLSLLSLVLASVLAFLVIFLAGVVVYWMVD